MKKIKTNKNIIIAILSIIIIVAGSIVVFTAGFNFDLRFSESKRITLYLEKQFEISDIKQITDEVFQGQEVIIQKVEVYEDEASITTNEITDEQKSNIITKVNEKYSTTLQADAIEVKTIPNTHGKDLVEPYILSFAISTAIILLYLIIRYNKLGWWKVALKTIGMTALIESLLISVIAITRIPVGRLTIPMVIAAYMLTLIGLTTKFEKQLEIEKASRKTKKSSKDKNKETQDDEENV